LSAQGWRLLQGQAVWKPAKDKPELAGELLLATRTNGDTFVEFAKTPIPLVAAQSIAGQWQIEFGNGDRVCSGRREPPTRFIWFQLPRVMAGTNLSSGWRVEHTAAKAWRLENARTGEILECYLSP